MSYANAIKLQNNIAAENDDQSSENVTAHRMGELTMNNLQVGQIYSVGGEPNQARITITLINAVGAVFVSSNPNVSSGNCGTPMNKPAGVNVAAEFKTATKLYFVTDTNGQGVFISFEYRKK